MVYKELKIIGFVIFILLIIQLCDKFSNIKVCVCTCGKYENKYAREFVEYYKKYGVDKIFIFDNNEVNGERFESVILDYINEEFVTIINYRGLLKIQMKAFSQCYNENKDKYNWLIYYDMDEFIHLEGYNNIKTYLSKSKFDKCNIIYLNHIIHTDNNDIYYQNKSLVKRFPKIENFKNINMSYQPRTILLDLTKIIIKGNLTDFEFGSPHFINNVNNTCNGFGKKITHIENIHLEKPDHKKFYFDHYYFKSSEEYLDKLTKGCVFYGKKRGFDIYWFKIYFAFNDITKEKLDYFENKTGTNLSIFREKIL